MKSFLSLQVLVSNFFYAKAKREKYFKKYFIKNTFIL